MHGQPGPVDLPLSGQEVQRGDGLLLIRTDPTWSGCAAYLPHPVWPLPSLSWRRLATPSADSQLATAASVSRRAVSPGRCRCGRSTPQGRDQHRSRDRASSSAARMGIGAVGGNPAGLECDRLGHPPRRKRGQHAGRRRRRRHLLRRSAVDRAVGVHGQINAEPLCPRTDTTKDRESGRVLVTETRPRRFHSASDTLRSAGDVVARTAVPKWARIAASGIGQLLSVWKSHCPWTPAGVPGNTGPGPADD